LNVSQRANPHWFRHAKVSHLAWIGWDKAELITVSGHKTDAVVGQYMHANLEKCAKEHAEYLLGLEL
jgi:site-specific recombinase XerD